MATVTLSKWGNGQGILLPRQLREKLGLKLGDKLNVDAKDGTLTVKPTKSYRIEDLLDGYSGPKPEEYDWGKPMGKEMW
ncbi:MAG: AbrB/MazE/SpoVT family DNA-binding domain-containing protein [Coriobacteriia bacterium]|nr:AbrB/MazE/SpoVT family DNA-binding domain-containing protein [Coriobacteriia bacterium]